MDNFESGRGKRNKLLEKAHEKEIEDARVLFVGEQVLSVENITVEAVGPEQEQAMKDYEAQVKDHAELLRTRRDIEDLAEYGNPEVLKYPEQSNN